MKGRNPNQISIYQKNERINIAFHDIICVEAAGCYSIFHTRNNNIYVSCHPLKYYEQLFAKASFFRINRSFLINQNYITYFHIDTRELILSNKLQLTVSFRKCKSFVTAEYGNCQKLKYKRYIQKLNTSNLTAKI